MTLSTLLPSQQKLCQVDHVRRPFASWSPLSSLRLSEVQNGGRTSRSRERGDRDESDLPHLEISVGLVPDALGPAHTLKSGRRDTEPEPRHPLLTEEGYRGEGGRGGREEGRHKRYEPVDANV